ncbi:hypothetical protein JTE90_003037 [Oedothorax gibbosus]|uniref:Protein regulator of cytokinesis 1 n=1 Tax=Oedothorax gibbosus TaxID=931172 RepID=A0AAV6VDI4_9ARAC|nr:hypothetical protein JTE90_003037 [Oedothorax gibbosus]
MNTEREIKCGARMEKVKKDIETELIVIIRHQMERIFSVWYDLDLDIKIQIQRARIIWNHVQNLLKDVYIEERTFYELYEARIKSYKKKIEDLHTVLQTTPEPVVAGSWISQEENLSQELDKLTKSKINKIEAYKKLKNEERKLCQKLNLKEHRPINTEVPLQNDILELEKQVKVLNEEKERRQVKFDAARKELLTMLEGTEFLPESPLEEEIICNKSISTLTDDTFEALKDVSDKVQRRKEKLVGKKTILIETLTVLWQNLKVPGNKRNEFLSKHADFSLSTFDAIEQEIEKCKAIESGKIKSYISNKKTELAHLWDECHVSQPEREKFPYLHSTEWSIEGLEAHKLEVDKWKNYFSKVEHILKKIDKRKLVWDTLNVLEEAANDPNRFRSSNRNFLNEFKERVELNKDLKDINKDIFEDIKELETKDGSKFLYNGEDFKAYVDNQNAQRNHKKENQKVKKRNEDSFSIKTPVVKTRLRRTSSVKVSKSTQPQLIRSKTLYMDNNFKTSNQSAKTSNQNSGVHKRQFVQKSKDVNLQTPRTVNFSKTMNFSQTAPSKFFKPLKTMSPFSTPTIKRSKVAPNTVAGMTSKSSIRPGYLLQKK